MLRVELAEQRSKCAGYPTDEYTRTKELGKERDIHVESKHRAYAGDKPFVAV